MAVIAIYTISDSKRVIHVHFRENGNDVMMIVVPFTSRANLRANLQSILADLQTEFTRIRGEV